MGSFHQFFSVHHVQFLDLLEHSKLEEISDRIIQAVGDKCGWEVEFRQSADFIREACEQVFSQRQYQCKNCGYVYFGLMLLCEHESLPTDGWKVQFTEDVVHFVKNTSVPDYVKDVFAGLIEGRNPHFELMHLPCEDVIPCFIRAEEAKSLFDDINNCNDFAEGRISNPDVEEIIFNDFLPAVDREFSSAHCLAVFTL